MMDRKLKLNKFLYMRFNYGCICVDFSNSQSLLLYNDSLFAWNLNSLTTYLYYSDN